MMFELFDKDARALVKSAESEAKALNHEYIGTEHFLLALTRIDNPVVKEFLSDFSVTSEDVEKGITELVGKGSTQPTGPLPFTPRMKAIMRYVTDSARDFLEYVAPINLLIRIIGEGEGVGATILKNHDVTEESIANKMKELREGRIEVDLDPVGYHVFKEGDPEFEKATRLIFKREIAQNKIDELEARLRRLALKTMLK